MIGTTLLKIGRFLFNEEMFTGVVEPTIADLQREMADAGSGRFARLRIGSRGYLAFWKLVLVAPLASLRSHPHTSAMCELSLHEQYGQHCLNSPGPVEILKRTPQINYSSTDVAGNIGGLIFVVGSIFIVVVGVPAVIWFLFAGTAAGCVVAWRLVATHAKHPESGLPKPFLADT